MLDDLVFPAEVVGKRIRFKLDGTRLLKVHLDQSQQTNIDHKVRSEKNCLLVAVHMCVPFSVNICVVVINA